MSECNGTKKEVLSELTQTASFIHQGNLIVLL